MIDPSILINSLVALLKDIPDLVAEMNGDPERINAYHDQYPKRSRCSASKKNRRALNRRT